MVDRVWGLSLYSGETSGIFRLQMWIRIMNLEVVKYIIWVSDFERCAKFYVDVLGGEVTRQNPHVTELKVCGITIGIRGGGEKKCA